MRGSPQRLRQKPQDGGIIPAHAGLTQISHSSSRPPRDHPRACGAHALTTHMPRLGAGSSPRMRGSRSSKSDMERCRGIIPAHAGLTVSASRRSRRNRDHPRACGAHNSIDICNMALSGSSPRMRGSRHHDTHRDQHQGIIPAHAGLTKPGQPVHAGGEDHPRACGAHIVPDVTAQIFWGSSPRMRGSH